MVVTVQVELLLCAGLTFLMDNIAHTLNPNWKMPLFLEMVFVSLIVGAVVTNIVSKFFQTNEKIASGYG